MASADEEYLIKRNQQFHKRTRIMTIVSIVAFFSSIVFGGVQAIQKSISPPQGQVVSAETSLEQEVQGYEQILKREPNNQHALEKLSLLRIKMKDFQGSMDILERLRQQHPDRQDYQVLWEQIKKRQAQ